MLDLNNHLFEAMERLNRPDLNGVALDDEIAKSKAMLSIAGGIIETARVVIDAQKTLGEINKNDVPELLRLENKDA